MKSYFFDKEIVEIRAITAYQSAKSLHNHLSHMEDGGGCWWITSGRSEQIETFSFQTGDGHTNFATTTGQQVPRLMRPHRWMLT